MARWHVAGRLLVLCDLACFLACRQRSATAPAPAEAVVRRQTVEDVFLLTGELSAVRSTVLAVPRVEGFRVAVKWLAEDGAEVQAGQTVAELDATQAAQGLEERRQRVVQAQVELDQLRATLAADRAQKGLDLDKAEVEAEKARIEAAVPQEVRSRQEWHQKQQALQKAEADLAKARLAVATAAESGRAQRDGLVLARDKAAREVRAAEAALRDLKMTAPRAGLVILGRAPNEDRPLQAGDILWPGLRLASMPDTTAMEVVATLSDVDEGRVKAGQRARVVLDADPDHAVAGRVEDVSAVADAARAAGGFRVRVSVHDALPALARPGLSARVEVVRAAHAGALTVPRRALVARDGRWGLQRSGSGQWTEVNVLAWLPLDCVVEGSVREGDRVALR